MLNQKQYFSIVIKLVKLKSIVFTLKVILFMSQLLKNIKSLKLENVTKSFGVLKVLENVNFEFCGGNTYLIKGSSGVGKSTLINILAGVELPTLGCVYYNNYNVNNIGKGFKIKLFQSSIGLIFQYPYLIKELNVLENTIIRGLILNQNKQILIKSAYDLLEKVGLADKRFNYPSQLSGGEQQRVSLARALLNTPDFLIADEPTAHLDEQNKTLILNLILEYQKTLNMGLIVTSHDQLLFQRIKNHIEIKDYNLLANFI